MSVFNTVNISLQSWRRIICMLLMRSSLTSPTREHTNSKAAYIRNYSMSMLKQHSKESDTRWHYMGATRFVCNFRTLTANVLSLIIQNCKLLPSSTTSHYFHPLHPSSQLSLQMTQPYHPFFLLINRRLDSLYNFKGTKHQKKVHDINLLQ